MAVIINTEECTGCGCCEDVCPVGAIRVENDRAVVNDDCVACGACVDECPNGVISLECSSHEWSFKGCYSEF